MSEKFKQDLIATFFVVNILLVYKLGKKWAATQAFCADMVRQIGLMKT